MENNKELLNENNEILENNENTEVTEEPKKKSPIPFIIFGIAAIIAVVIVYFIFSNLSNENDTPQVAEPEEIQVGLTDYSATDEELESLKELNAVVDEYVKTNYDELGIVSAYGFLHSIETGNTIMVRDLVNDGLFMADENVINNTDLLYLKASDVGLNGNEFIPCTAFNTKDGYYLSATGLEGKYYPEVDYNKLVLSYSFAHGNIVNPKPGDDNYKNILAAAAIGDNYDVKHITCDEKYAVVVANNINNTSEFIHSVLVNTDGKWTIGIGNLASAANAKQTANKQYPDMELGLMPIYNIGDYPTIMSDLSTFTTQLVDLGMLNENETESLYTCSAGSFAYIQTKDGRRLLGYMGKNDKLEFYEMQTLEETISTMVRVQSDPPVFIIKFN